MNKVPLIKPTLMGKKTIFKTDTIPTKGSNNIVTSDALAQALQDKVVNKEEEGEKTIVPTGDIVIGRLLEDGFYILDPTFLGTKLIKVETPEPGKFYYDKTTRTYYTFRGYNETGYNFKPVVLPNLTELTWQELKDLRNDSRLIPGSLYRITDYQCTTTQANTQSAGHQFDIVLLALSEGKLAEEGWAMHHIDDTYFANSNLSAWRIWYCLDNDTSRFAWADDNVIGDIENIVVYYPESTNFGVTKPAHDVVYTPTNETQIVNGVTYFKLTILEKVHIDDEDELFVDTKNINTETTLYILNTAFGTTTVQASPGGISIKSINYNTPPTEEGRGVIYRLIDEWNNDCPYDFKNILFLRKITNAIIDNNSGNEKYIPTFCLFDSDTNEYKDASIFSINYNTDDNFIRVCRDNKINYFTTDQNIPMRLNGNVFLAEVAQNDTGLDCYGNTISALDCSFIGAFNHNVIISAIGVIYKNFGGWFISGDYRAVLEPIPQDYVE